MLEQGGQQPSSSDHPRDGREEALQQREQCAQQVISFGGNVPAFAQLLTSFYIHIQQAALLRGEEGGGEGELRRVRRQDRLQEDPLQM